MTAGAALLSRVNCPVLTAILRPEGFRVYQQEIIPSTTGAALFHQAWAFILSTPQYQTLNTGCSQQVAALPVLAVPAVVPVGGGLGVIGAVAGGVGGGDAASGCGLNSTGGVVGSHGVCVPVRRITNADHNTPVSWTGSD